MGLQNTSTSRDRVRGALRGLAELGLGPESISLVWGGLHNGVRLFERERDRDAPGRQSCDGHHCRQ
jgi:hypothetical protein